jgi:hypothetical protein
MLAASIALISAACSHITAFNLFAENGHGGLFQDDQLQVAADHLRAAACRIDGTFSSQPVLRLVA